MGRGVFEDDGPWKPARRVPWLFRIAMWLWCVLRLLLFGSRRSGRWDSAILSNTGSAISKTGSLVSNIGSL